MDSSVSLGLTATSSLHQHNTGSGKHDSRGEVSPQFLQPPLAALSCCAHTQTHPTHTHTRAHAPELLRGLLELAQVVKRQAALPQEGPQLRAERERSIKVGDRGLHFVLVGGCVVCGVVWFWVSEGRVALRGRVRHGDVWRSSGHTVEWHARAATHVAAVLPTVTHPRPTHTHTQTHTHKHAISLTCRKRCMPVRTSACGLSLPPPSMPDAAAAAAAPAATSPPAISAPEPPTPAATPISARLLGSAAGVLLCGCCCRCRERWRLLLGRGCAQRPARSGCASTQFCVGATLREHRWSCLG
jgi:hypothetical protein